MPSNFQLALTALAVSMTSLEAIHLKGFFDHSKSLESIAARMQQQAGRPKPGTIIPAMLTENETDVYQDEPAIPVPIPKTLPKYINWQGVKSVEKQVLGSTILKADLYFGGRETIGTPIKYPFLCYVLLTKRKELNLLRANIVAFGSRCDWAITANLAHGLTINTTELNAFVAAHGSNIVNEDYRVTAKYFVKTRLWKDIVMAMHRKYSHVWFIDADIMFTGQSSLDKIEKDWLCGSVGGHPPLISQPTINGFDNVQDYPHVNYYSQYDNSHLSMIATKVIENQVALVDMSLAFWLFKEVVEPYFEKQSEYLVTAWGLSRTWCGAAHAYIQLNADYLQNKSLVENVVLPKSCGVAVHPVHHVGTRSINKTVYFVRTGHNMIIKLHALFPTWSVDFVVSNSYPMAIIRLANSIRNFVLQNSEESELFKTEVMLRNESVCPDRVGHGHYRDVAAYVWLKR